MTIRKLPSGYWHVRFGLNRFAQWPSLEEPRDDDYFGWWSEQEKRQAAAMARKQEGAPR